MQNIKEDLTEYLNTLLASAKSNPNFGLAREFYLQAVGAVRFAEYIAPALSMSIYDIWASKYEPQFDALLDW